MPEQDNWKEEFENQFPCMGLSNKTSNSVYRHDQFIDDKSLLESFIESLLSSQVHALKKQNRTITERDVFRVQNESGTWIHFSLKRLGRDSKVQRAVEQSETVEFLSAIESIEI